MREVTRPWTKITVAWGTETIDVKYMKISRPSDIIDVGVERKWGVEDDTKTLDVRGGGHYGAIGGGRETVKLEKGGFGANIQEFSFVTV